MKSLLVFATMCCALLVGCHTSSHSPKPYTIDITAEVDYNTNQVVAIVDLDSRLVGALLLYLDGNLANANVVLKSGEIDLGVLPAGSYELVLEGYEKDGDFAGDASDSFTLLALPCSDQDQDGLCDDEDPCPEDPTNACDDDNDPDKPYIVCNFNEEGGTAVTIELGTNGFGAILHRLDDVAGEFDAIVDSGDVVLDIPLERDRTYTFVLLSVETDEELARCELVIPDLPPDDDDDDPEFDPCDFDKNGEVSECEQAICELDRSKKYIVKHRTGSEHHPYQCIIVGWHALKAHVCGHGDNLGVAVDRRGRRN